MKELTVSEWKDELNSGLEFRRAHGLEDSWASLEALFYNVHGSSGNGPNLISSSGDTLLSSLSVPFPYIMVDPVWNARFAKGAKILERLDNQLLWDLEVCEEVELAELYAFLWGVGVVKMGYDSEFGWDEDLDEWGQYGQLGMTMSQFDKTGNRIEFDATIRPGMPWVRACLPHDIIVPYGTRRMKDAPWVAHRIVRHIDLLKSDRKYKKPKSLVPSMSMEDFVKSYLTVLKPYRIGESEWVWKEGTSDTVFCELFEIHDRRTKGIYVIATGCTEFVRKREDLLQVDGSLPFEDIRFVPTARTFWTTPDAYYLKFHQAELSDIALQATKQRRISTLKFAYDETAFEDPEIEKVVSADVGVGIKLSPGRKFEDVVHPFQFNNNNMLLQQDAEYIRRDAREVTGTSRNQMGEYESRGRRTATEVSEVSSASGMRMTRREIVTSRLYRRLFKKMNGMITRFWQIPRWVQTIGKDGSALWQEFVGKDLKGEYSYDVVFAKDGLRSFSQRRQENMMLIQFLMQDPRVPKELILGMLQSGFINGSVRGEVENAALQLQMSQVPQGGGAAQTPSRVQQKRPQSMLPRPAQ